MPATLGYACHSVHTSYLCGVSVLVHWLIDFVVYTRLVDGEGRYIFFHCKIFDLTCVLAVVYILPPFSTVVLRQLVYFLLDKPDVPSLKLGNCIGYMCPEMNKHPPVVVGPYYPSPTFI